MAGAAGADVLLLGDALGPASAARTTSITYRKNYYLCQYHVSEQCDNWRIIGD